MRSPAAAGTDYPSKFLAIYYIDMMLGFVDDFAVCCIGIFGGIDNAKYIMEQSPIQDGVGNKLIKFKDNIKSVRYEYKQGNIETEVKHIEFFLRGKEIQSYTSLETSSYYTELRYIYVKLGHPKRGKKISTTQHAHISTILKNPQYSDKEKLEEIQKYTIQENKELVKTINDKTSLNKMSLVSVDEKLKLLTQHINKLESIINQNFWTAAGKKSYNEYLEIVRTQGTLGGKRTKAIKQRSIAKRGGVGSRFRRLLGIADTGYKVIPSNEDVSQDYMTVLYKYTDGHIDKLRQLYDTIVFIYNYAEYHRKKQQQFKQEYGYLLKEVKGFNKRDLRVDEKQILAILNKHLDLTDTSHYVRNILHNFKILKGRKVELERKIALYYA
jgi:hypothetical protein